MKQVSRVLVNYSADLFGMCSALYELGGLCVMDDASGCNSTYDTHDEPRWFDMDSMVYISALTESDAVMGNDEKLICDICEVAHAEHPTFIALGGSPIPMIMGTDFNGIARVIEKRTGIPSFGIRSSGMHTYEIGAGAAFAELVDAFCIPAVLPEQAAALRKERNQLRITAAISSGVRVNLLGVTPLDFSIVGNAEALVQFFSQNGCTVVSSWAMNNTLEQLAQAGTADVNVVVSAAGLPAAHRLQEIYGTPYITGIPVGDRPSRTLLERIYAAAAVKTDGSAAVSVVTAAPAPQYRAASRGIPLLKETSVFRNRQSTAYVGGPVIIIGEPVFASSLRLCLEQDFGMNTVQVVCPLEESAGVLRPCDVCTDEEDDIMHLLEHAGLIIADPVYRRVLPSGRGVPFIDFPHEAYSGRLYRADIPVFIGSGFVSWLQTRL
jgi:nitrogenase molybdenum-cofactor synthesis protein NifE